MPGKAAKSLLAAVVASGVMLSAHTAAAQNVSVTAANPNTGAQGTTALIVKISGKNFAPGAMTDFFLSGTTNPAGITVHGTQWISASEVDATIDIADTASIAQFDVKVTNTTGRSGKGSDMFSVIQKGTSSCSLEPLDSRLSLEQDFNPGGSQYGALGPSSLVGRATVSASGGPANTVLVVALGTNSTQSRLELFFVDPISGALLDGQPLCVGCNTQPHVTLVVPAGGGAKFTALGNLNGDGAPDFVAAEANAANLFVSSVSASGVITWTVKPIPTPVGASTFGWDVAMGDVNGDGLDEVAVTQIPSGSGKSAQRGAVYLYRYSGGVVSLIDTITEASVSPAVSSGDNFGYSVAIGDVSGDARADVIVGLPTRTVNGQSGAGAVFVFESTPAGVSRTAKMLVSSVATVTWFGSQVVAGHVQGSKPADVVASTRWGTSSTGGEVFPSPVVNGQVGTLRFTPRSGFDTGWATKKFAVGDVNGDGLGDIIVGAPNAGNSSQCDSPGMAYLFLSTNDGAGHVSGWTRIDWQGLQPGRYGWSVGLADGAPFVVVGQTDAADAFLYEVFP
jgi:hypothetical protein